MCRGSLREADSWMSVRTAGGLGPPLRHGAGQEEPQHEAQRAGGVRTQRCHL